MNKFSSLVINAKVLIVFMFFTTTPVAFGQLSLDYYLPEMEYDKTLPTPKSVLGFEIGEWHITHGQLYLYMTTLCEASENCTLTEYARSHENKPLFYLTISSAENMSNLEPLRKAHKSLTNPALSENINLDDVPLVLYQGYSVHGDESSGANASTLVAYYLLAGKSAKLDSLLGNTIILLDPCFNPDGLQRFSTWANSNRHSRLNTDPADREFNESWPSGRTNHYWFDLNRDWLFTIHPSSKGRIKTFHEWKPDILTDHHEMGSNSTFFFQPGVPSRTNPNTPEINQRLTEEIGEYHASFLDSIGSMYFTKERYDDYYYGKGSTYPDINGCIGILFEQATSEGHLRETRNGLLSFPFTIRNQVVTSLSTQQAALEKKNEILDYKRNFFRDVRNSKISQGYYIFEENDAFVSRFFCDLLQRHEIDVYKTSKTINLNNQSFNPAHSYIVPKNQYQAGLIKSLFEKVNTFRDSVFYDVSAWTLPLAFNVKYAESNRSLPASDLKAFEQEPQFKDDIFVLDTKTTSIAIDWDSYMVPAALNKLFEKDIKVRALKQPNNYATSLGEEEFKAGTLIIPLSAEESERKGIAKAVGELVKKYNINVRQIFSGLAVKGQSIGSNDLGVLEAPSIAIIVGEGVNAYEAGDTWYQLDKRWDMKVSLIDIIDLSRTNLARYNIIIMPDGNYNDLEKSDEKLQGWLLEGGTLLAFRRALSYMQQKNWISELKSVEITKEDDSGERNFTGSRESNQIGGTILNADVTLDHPLLFGYDESKLPVFKKGTQFYTIEKKSAVPVCYDTKELVLSGYLSAKNRALAPGAASVFAASYGRGRIIASVDNPNFRAYWLGGSRLFANMIFMSSLISRDSML